MKARRIANDAEPTSPFVTFISTQGKNKILGKIQFPEAAGTGIAYDGGAAPAYTMGTFTSTTVPGCRVPHVWLEGPRSLYDAMGQDYTLLRLDPTVRVDGIVAAAAQRGLPLAVLDLKSREAMELYRHALVLVRPDQHVAWRANAEPADPVDLVDLVRGAKSA